MSLVQGLHDDWYLTDAPEDVELIAVLIEDAQGEWPDTADIEDFIRFTSITFPLLGDTEGAWIDRWGAGSSGVGRHTYTIVASDGTVGWRKDDGSSGSVEEITGGLDIVD